MPFPANEVERNRLREIWQHWRIINGRCAPIPYSPLVTPSEWTGWQILNPAGGPRNLLRRGQRTGICTRCGSQAAAPRQADVLEQCAAVSCDDGAADQPTEESRPPTLQVRAVRKGNNHPPRQYSEPETRVVQSMPAQRSGMVRSVRRTPAA